MKMIFFVIILLRDFACRVIAFNLFCGNSTTLWCLRFQGRDGATLLRYREVYVESTGVVGAAENNSLFFR